jgi:hypothetical protein
MHKAESRRRRRIITALKEKFPSGLFFHVHGNPFQEAGIPDIIGCVEGQFFGFEVKEPDGEPTKIQIHFGVRIKTSGGIFALVEEPEEAILVISNWLHRQKQANSATGSQ